MQNLLKNIRNRSDYGNQNDWLFWIRWLTPMVEWFLK